jgi:uncharacterized membrane protein YhhN
MPVVVVLLVALVGAIHLAAHYTERPVLAGAVKAAPILALAAVTATADPAVSRQYAVLVTAGLLFSAVGDVCLAFPDRFFTAGLASFLVAHCCYLAAFAVDAGQGGWALPWLAAIGLAAAALLGVLWPHLGRDRAPVLVYVVVIAAMAWTAARRGAAAGAPEPSATLALAGALVFMVSDSVLAVDRFARPFRASHAVVMVTYYVAQTLIAASVPASS